MKRNIRNFNLVRAFKLDKFQKPTIILLSIAVVVLANILLSPVSFRFDASNGKAYTLSPASKKVIKSLKDPIDITFFISSDIPTKLIPLKADVVALLDEYKRESGKIKVSLADPKKDEKTAASAQAFGVQPLQFSQLEQDKYAVSTAYFGIGIGKGTSRESIPQVTDIGSLEYNITSAIYKLTRKDIPKIGILENQEFALQDRFQTLKGVLGKQFTVDTPRISTQGAEVYKTYKALLLADDQTNTYTDTQVKDIKNYIKSGGKVLLFVDGVWVNAQADFAQAVSEAKHNLFGLVKDFGIDLNRDLVLSANSEIVNFGAGGGSYLAQYPFWIRTQNVDTKSSYFSNITQLTYPWVSSLTLNKVKGVETAPLIQTSAQSWKVDKNINIDPQQITQPKVSDLKKFTVAAEASLGQNGKLLVIPSSRFAQDGFLSRASDNLEFVINVLNAYVSAGALSGISSRSVNIYPLPDLPASQKDFFKYANILLLPALFGIYGAWRLIRRK